jgi:hypothetical protein
MAKQAGTIIQRLTLAIALILPTMTLAATPPVEGTMSVEATTMDGGPAPSPDIYRDAAARALADKGFTLLEGAGHAAFTMQLAVSTSEAGTGEAQVATSGSKVAKGGVSGAVGSAFNIPMPSGKSRLVALERTQLDMTLRKRGSEEIVWHGTALTVRSAATPGTTADDLCNALLRQYPAQPEAVIGVP